MNKKVKAMLASYLRSFLGAALAAGSIAGWDWKVVIAAGLSAVLPVALRAANPNDAAFGMIADATQIELDKLAKAATKKPVKKTK
jgi:hypothetical protein